VDEYDQPALRVSRLLGAKYHCIAFYDGTRVVIDALGERIWVTAPETATVEDTATYLLGPVLGFLLRLRGVTCLHASAVAIAGRGVALVGPSGAGKSSTAAAFARLGYPVLAEDVVALRDHGDYFEVQPAYPRVRLWQEAVTGLFGSADALPRITHNWDKQYLDLKGPGYRFQYEALPLAAIYFLGPRDSDPALPVIQPVNPSAGLMSLVSDTFATNLLDKSMRAGEFELLGRLVGSVPLRQVNPEADMAKLPALCEAISADFRQL